MRLEHRNAKVVALLVFAAICIAIFFYLYGAAGGSMPFSSHYTVTAHVPDAFQLVPNSDVRSAGVQVGKVDEIRNEGGITAVKMQIDDDAAEPIYRNAQVRVRTKTLVGENYLDLEPGTPSAGKVPDGGELPVARARPAVELDKILSSLDRPTRARIKRDLDAMGPALAGRGTDLQKALTALQPAVTSGSDLMRVLDGQKQQVAAVLDNAGRTMQAFADRTEQTRQLARQAKATAVAVAARDRELGDFFDELPSTLRQAQHTVGVLGDFSATATPVVSDLRQASAPLDSVLRDLRPAARSTRVLFRELPAALKVANPLVGKLRTFSKALGPAAPAVEALARQLSPALGYLQHYSREVGAYFADNGAPFIKVGGYSVGRVMPIVGPNTLTVFNPQLKKAFQALVKVGLAGTDGGTKTNSYPAPGTNGSPQPGDGNYPRIGALPAPAGTEG